jgi:hypothetical protein
MHVKTERLNCAESADPNENSRPPFFLEAGTLLLSELLPRRAPLTILQVNLGESSPTLRC